MCITLIFLLEDEKIYMVKPLSLAISFAYGISSIKFKFYLILIKISRLYEVNNYIAIA